MEQLTQMPSLLDISRSQLEAEYRGTIAQARIRVRTLTAMVDADPRSLRVARRNLASLLILARAEKVRL